MDGISKKMVQTVQEGDPTIEAKQPPEFPYETQGSNGNPDEELAEDIYLWPGS